MAIQTNVTLDATGLACPMPIVKTKKAMNAMEPGQVLEVLATDKGSKADLQAWAASSGHQYIGIIEEGSVLKHYLRKSNGEEETEKKHPYVISNEELTEKLHDSSVIIIDVREAAEYAFTHIPGAVSIPLGDLEKEASSLNKEAEIYVVCRTGNRSDLAAQQLAKQGFQHVINVVPGMSQWTGATESL